ncbi:MAG: anti-sigma factor antagonist [Balneolaceae bacterium]|jgi:anti-anti-sigma factor|nr:MAG: anti-sigma factor antagonist [Balneolaceae bacterium]
MLTIDHISDGVIRLSGRFDAAQADMAMKELENVSDDTTLDFEELAYISSMGLGILIKTHKQLQEKGKVMRIINVNKHIKDVFRFTSLDKIFKIE